MSRKRCKRVIRRALAPTLVALHLNPEVCLQERGAVLAVRGGWATTDHFNVLADCRDMLMLAANERDDKSAIAACTVAGIALMNMKDRHATSWALHKADGCVDSWSSDSGWAGRCPYGQPGDRLWVREHWRTYASLDDIPPRAIAPGAGVQYEASGSNVIGAESLHGMGKFRPGMFMPRWASRILLEITAVRVERLQDISEADARAEGIAAFDVAFAGDKRRDPLTQQHPTVRFADAFCDLWQSINGEQLWHENPWVWVVEFKRVQP